jgi:chromosome segregation ATPase
LLQILLVTDTTERLPPPFLRSEHVTFVSGQNGSGKSALLQGLQACLGASARDTGRGSNLGAWVKRGKRTATVTLEIWNTTSDEVDGSLWPPFRREM